MKNKKYLDIGKGSNIALNVTEDKLKKAVEMLKIDGYQVWFLLMATFLLGILSLAAIILNDR